MKKKLLSAAIATLLILSSIPFQDVAHASTAEIVKSVNFRNEPSLSGDRIRYLRDGEKVDVIGKVNTYWYKIKDSRNQIGYVTTMNEYVNLLSPAKSGSRSVKSTNATITWGVSFRSGPSTDYQRMRYLQKGERITILEQINKYWYKIEDRNGTTGYVSSSDRFIDTSYRFTDNSNRYNSDNTSALAQKVINAGIKYLGTPYEFGSNRYNTNTFDCSDFVRQAYLDGIGLKLPMDSRKQGRYVQDVGDTSTNWRNLKPGDIIFFMSYKGSQKSDYNGINKSNQRITHNGIYLGNGKVLHTYSKKSGGVRIDSIEGHWEYRFLFGGNPVK